MSVNKVILIGRLGQDPEVRSTPAGAQVCTMSVATNEAWKNRDGKLEERTEWHRVVLWGRQAELAQKYLKKGRQVFIEGKLQTRSYEDKQGGGKRYTTEIVASNMQFIDGNNRTGGDEMGDTSSMPHFDQGHDDMGSSPAYDGPASRSGSNTGASRSAPIMDDDIPF